MNMSPSIFPATCRHESVEKGGNLVYLECGALTPLSFVLVFFLYLECGAGMPL
jgi:hypothetical protein